MTANLTLDELATMAYGAARSPDGSAGCECWACGPGGVLAPMLPGGDPAHPFVERCDLCEIFPDDGVAAEAVARMFGLVVRRRYDDDSLRYWRSFLARSGSPDDCDFVCVEPDEFGCWPSAEIALVGA